MAPSRAALSLFRVSPRIRPRIHTQALHLRTPPRRMPSLPARPILPRPPQRQRRNLSASSTSTPAATAAVDIQGNSLEPPDYLNEKEMAIFEKLRLELQPAKLEVQDISGGCGSMYAIDIVSARFKGLSMIKQHRLVNGVLGEEIKGWHGVQLKTRAS